MNRESREIEHIDGSHEIVERTSWTPAIVGVSAALVFGAWGILGVGPGVGTVATGSGAGTATPAASYSAPNTPTIDVTVFAATGDSVALLGSVFVGSLDDTHDSTEFQVDTIDADWSTPVFASFLGAIETDTADSGIDSAGVYKARVRYEGANGGWSDWSDSLSFTAENFTLDPFSEEPTGWPGYERKFNRNFNSKASNDADRGSGTPPNETGGSEGWDGAEYNDSNFGIVSCADSTGTTEPDDDGNNNCGVMEFPSGCCNAGSPAHILTELFNRTGNYATNYDSIYISASFYWDSDYDAYSGWPNKFIWFKSADGSPTNTFIGFQNSGGGFGSFNFVDGQFQQTVTTSSRFSTSGACDAMSGYTVDRDKWHTLQIRATNNTTGNADGTAEYWVQASDEESPTKVANCTAVEWVTSGTEKWGTIHIQPIYGGSSQTPSQDGHLYFGHVHIGAT